MSVQSDIATAIQTQLRALTGALSSGVTGIDAIAQDAVVIRPMQFDTELWDRWRTELSPGWVIGIGKEVESDPNEGNEAESDVIYQFYLCGLDKNDDYLDFNRTVVWSNRAQAARRYFHMTNLQAATVGGIKTTLCWSPGTVMYNEQVRKLYHLVQVVLPIMVKIREPRDASGVG